MNKKSVFYNFICPILSVGVILAVWSVIAAIYDKPLIFPSAASVCRKFFLMFADGKFYVSAALTFARSLACFAAAFAFASACAVAAAFCKTFERILNPIVELLRTVPVIAVILLTLVLFSSSTVPILVGFLTLFPLMYTAFLSVLTSDKMKDNLQMCSLYKARRRDVARYVILPKFAPTAFEQGETLLPLAVKIVISGEVLAYARNSLGLLMRSAQMNVETDKLAAYAFVAVLLSYIAKLSVKALKAVFRRCKLCR